MCHRRLGTRDVPVKVRLEVDWQPERYQLSQGLASLLGMELETRARIIEVCTPEPLFTWPSAVPGTLCACCCGAMPGLEYIPSQHQILRCTAGCCSTVSPRQVLAGGMVLHQALQMPDPRRPHPRRVQRAAQGIVRG